MTFHSRLPHMVQENRSEEDSISISISFDVMLKGPVGVESTGAMY